MSRALNCVIFQINWFWSNEVSLFALHMWHIFIHFITWASAWTGSVTLKKEAVLLQIFDQTKKSSMCKHPKYNHHLDNNHETWKIIFYTEVSWSSVVGWLGFLARMPGMLLSSQHGRLCHQCSSWSSFLWKIMRSLYLRCVDQDSEVSIVTVYGLHGPGIESWCGWDFPHQPWGPPSLLFNGYWVFPRVKAARTWRWPPTPI